MAFNTTMTLMNTLYVQGFGNFYIAGIFILGFIALLGIKYRVDMAVYSVGVIAPTLIILSQYNYAPPFVRPALYILMGFATAWAMFKFWINS